MTNSLALIIAKWLGNYVWIMQIPLSICIAWLLFKLSQIVVFRLEKFFIKKQKKWTFYIALKASKKPMQFFFILISFVIILIIIKNNTNFMNWFLQNRAISVVFVISITWYLILFIRLTQEHLIYFSKKNKDKTSILALGQISIAFVVVISILIVLQCVGVNFAGLLAFGGFSGIAIGFAAKDLLANFLGALMIYMDNTFKVGDWISSPDKKIEGEVESIGWRQTKIITIEKKPIYVPNSFFSTIIVENASRMTHRHINEIICIKYSNINEVEKIISDIKNFISSHPKIDNSLPYIVGIVKIVPSSFEVMIYCFTTSTIYESFIAMKQEIFLGSVNIITTNGCEVFTPTTTICVKNNEK